MIIEGIKRNLWFRQISFLRGGINIGVGKTIEYI